MVAELGRSVKIDPVRTGYDWTGFYVGAHVDDSWSKTSGGTIDSATGAAVASINSVGSNWHGGIQVGYDYMLPLRFVIGLVADISSGGTKSTTLAVPSGTSASQNTIFDSETARGRLGYAVDNVSTT